LRYLAFSAGICGSMEWNVYVQYNLAYGTLSLLEDTVGEACAKSVVSNRLPQGRLSLQRATAVSVDSAVRVYSDTVIFIALPECS
jgi:hypothetical protein